MNAQFEMVGEIAVLKNAYTAEQWKAAFAAVATEFLDCTANCDGLSGCGDFLSEQLGVEGLLGVALDNWGMELAEGYMDAGLFVCEGTFEHPERSWEGELTKRELKKMGFKDEEEAAQHYENYLTKCAGEWVKWVGANTKLFAV